MQTKYSKEFKIELVKKALSREYGIPKENQMSSLKVFLF